MGSFSNWTPARTETSACQSFCSRYWTSRAAMGRTAPPREGRGGGGGAPMLVCKREVHALVDQVDPLDPVGEQELIAEVRALVEHARHRREVACPVGERK